MIQRILDRLPVDPTPADRRVMDAIAEAGANVAFLSAHDIAKAAGTHAATVVRFARKLGFAGYPALQADLRAHAARVQGPAARMRERLADTGPAGTLRQLVESEVDTLIALVEQVPPDRLDAAVDRLMQARRITVFGIGHAGVVADYLALRLERSGYAARALHHLDWGAMDRLAEIGPGDEVVAIVLRATSARFTKLSAVARRRGAGLILLGDIGAATLRAEGDLVLATTPSGRKDSSLVAPLVLCNALILELSRRDGGRSLAALERREELRADFPL